MSVVCDYLKTKKKCKQQKEVIDALLVALMSLEVTYNRTKSDYLFLQLKDFGLVYGEANGWVHYTKKNFLKEMQISLGDLKRELKLLEAEGRIRYHRLAHQTFIELVEETQEL